MKTFNVAKLALAITFAGGTLMGCDSDYETKAVKTQNSAPTAQGGFVVADMEYSASNGTYQLAQADTDDEPVAVDRYGVANERNSRSSNNSNISNNTSNIDNADEVAESTLTPAAENNLLYPNAGRPNRADDESISATDSTRSTGSEQARDQSEERYNEQFSNADSERQNIDSEQHIVRFEFDSDELDSEAQQALRDFAESVEDQNLDVAEISLKGYTDTTGPEDYNKDLARRRAEAVREYLEEQGLQANLKVEGVGEPDEDNLADNAWENRRVEINMESSQEDEMS